jgi:hypothetical protein
MGIALKHLSESQRASIDKKLLNEAVDEFIIPLANMAIDEGNTYNIVSLCRKAKKFMRKNCG